MSEHSQSQHGTGGVGDSVTPQETDPDNWQGCPQGAVDEVVRGVKLRRQRQRALKVTAIASSAMAVFMLMFVSVWAWRDDPQMVQPPIQPRNASSQLTCRQVRFQLDDYLAGKVDQELEKRIDDHMKHCPGCRRRIPHDHKKANLVARRLPKLRIPVATVR